MKPVDNSELQHYRGLQAMEVLSLMARHVKVDADFHPISAKSTRRVHVNAGDADWELLVEGPRFFDTRAGTGGGGAVDLVMHLWRVPFRKAVAMLRETHA
jgi:hypothetical protein